MHCFLLILVCLIINTKPVLAQQDSVHLLLDQLPVNYLKTVDKKISKYSERVSGKTMKTLRKCARWEIKIRKILGKVNPGAEKQLFAQGSLSFSELYAKAKQGENIIESRRKYFDSYIDKLRVNIHFIDSNARNYSDVNRSQINRIKNEIQQVDSIECQSEQIKKIIKERKKQLMQAGLSASGKIRALKKINKETYYYVESLKNYKEIFNNREKAEKLAGGLLKKIPGFEKFSSEHSVLSSLFPKPAGLGTSQAIAGLQTRASFQNMLESNFGNGNQSGMSFLKDQLQEANKELQAIRNKMQKYGSNNSSVNIPEGFKPNSQKSKTFKQRLEFGFNVQFSKSTSILPGAANIGGSIGYKFNDHATGGIGFNYRLGMGTVQKIKFTHEGAGVRSFLDWKIKKSWFAVAGYEWNYLPAVKKANQQINNTGWKTSALIGLSKKYKVSNKLKGNLQLMYDFFAKSRSPYTSAFVYRIGYNF